VRDAAVLYIYDVLQCNLVFYRTPLLRLAVIPLAWCFTWCIVPHLTTGFAAPPALQLPIAASPAQAQQQAVS
jgi:hypothetical protein